MPKLSISQEYLDRESNKWGKSVTDWVENYAKRNKIIHGRIIDRNTREGDARLELIFRSENQLNWFVRQGNKMWPYFEFI